MKALAKIKSKPTTGTAEELFVEEFVCNGGQQTYSYSSMGKVNGHKVRIAITKDSYLDQCVGKLDVWSDTDLRWNRAAELPQGSSVFRSMANPHSSDTVAHRKSCVFVKEVLLQTAKFILEPKQ